MKVIDDRHGLLQRKGHSTSHLWVWVLHSRLNAFKPRLVIHRLKALQKYQCPLLRALLCCNPSGHGGGGGPGPSWPTSAKAGPAQLARARGLWPSKDTNICYQEFAFFLGGLAQLNSYFYIAKRHITESLHHGPLYLSPQYKEKAFQLKKSLNIWGYLCICGSSGLHWKL